jgi:hypothetical protein
MNRSPRKKYTPEFKQQAVELVRLGKSVPLVLIVILFLLWMPLPVKAYDGEYYHELFEHNISRLHTAAGGDWSPESTRANECGRDTTIDISLGMTATAKNYGQMVSSSGEQLTGKDGHNYKVRNWIRLWRY